MNKFKACSTLPPHLEFPANGFSLSLLSHIGLSSAWEKLCVVGPLPKIGKNTLRRWSESLRDGDALLPQSQTPAVLILRDSENVLTIIPFAVDVHSLPASSLINTVIQVISRQPQQLYVSAAVVSQQVRIKKPKKKKEKGRALAQEVCVRAVDLLPRSDDLVWTYTRRVTVTDKETRWSRGRVRHDADRIHGELIAALWDRLFILSESRAIYRTSATVISNTFYLPFLPTEDPDDAPIFRVLQ